MEFVSIISHLSAAVSRVETVDSFLRKSISWLEITHCRCSCVLFSRDNSPSSHSKCVACLREIEKLPKSRFCLKRIMPEFGKFISREEGRTCRVATVVIWFATIRKLMYKMVRKSNERKAASSDESRGNSLPRTVIYRCWTAHEEGAVVRTMAAIYTDLTADPCERTRSW